MFNLAERHFKSLPDTKGLEIRASAGVLPPINGHKKRFTKPFKRAYAQLASGLFFSAAVFHGLAQAFRRRIFKRGDRLGLSSFSSAPFPRINVLQNMSDKTIILLPTSICTRYGEHSKSCSTISLAAMVSSLLFT